MAGFRPLRRFRVRARSPVRDSATARRDRAALQKGMVHGDSRSRQARRESHWPLTLTAGSDDSVVTAHLGLTFGY